nr:hypothetical protein [Desulfovibrio sp.]
CKIAAIPVKMEKEKRKVTMYDDIRKALRQLKATTPKNPPRKTLRTIISSLSKEIQQVIAAGHSLTDVAEVLKTVGGIEIKPGTLREYLRKERRNAQIDADRVTFASKQEKAEAHLDDVKTAADAAGGGR